MTSSPYRSAPSATRSARVVLCRACGRAQEVAPHLRKVACACGLAQPVLRDADDVAIASLAVASIDAGAYDELAPFCRAVGASSPCTQVNLVCDGVRCSVGLTVSSGVATGIAMFARTAGLPPMHLGWEMPSHVAAKASGTSREVQTGDDRFDRVVYIKSDASDEDILAVLEPPAVRAAVLRLLDGVHSDGSIELGPGGVSVSAYREKPGCFEPRFLLERVAALRVLAGAPRTREPKITVNRASRRALWLTAGTIPLGIASLVAAGLSYPPVHPGLLLGAGLTVGIALAIVLRIVLRPILRGRSDSHEDLLALTVAAVIGLSLLGMGGAMGINGLFDRSKERARVGAVVGTSYDSDDQATNVDVRGEAGLDTEFSVDDPTRVVKTGDAVTVWTRAGALGQEWETRPARVRTARGAFDEK